MSENLSLKKDTVQETMLGPLWARANRSQLYHGILEDPKAVEILEKIEYDFSDIEKLLGDWRGIGLLVRARSLDDAVVGAIRGPIAGLTTGYLGTLLYDLLFYSTILAFTLPELIQLPLLGNKTFPYYPRLHLQKHIYNTWFSFLERQ
ncbi:unnamed protein product [marine sediment metagenome]|uniref:Uncharacterized protein n=1 Tax=marine sediment metagenome TaxID=412755 RepID=X1C1A1_9ZZZZ